MKKSTPFQLLMVLVSLFFSQILSAQHFTTVWSNNPYNPMNIVIRGATLDGTGLVAGDEIGVFDIGNNGIQICVGAMVLTQTPTANSGTIIVVSQSDGTGGINGYTPGHKILFRYWKKSESKEIKTVFPTYTNSSGTSNVFTSLGTAVVELDGRSPVEITAQSVTTCPDNITLPVTVKNFWDIGSFLISVKYDTTALVFDANASKNTENAVISGNVNINTWPGHVTLRTVQDLSGVSIPNDGKLLNLVFKSKDKYTASRSTLQWRTDDSSFFRTSAGNELEGIYHDAGITVHAIPAVADTLYGSRYFCKGSTNNIFKIDTLKNATSYSWSIYPTQAGSLTAKDTSMSIDFYSTYSGTVLISVEASNGCGSGKIFSDSIHVLGNPVANAGPNKVICENDSIALSGNVLYAQSHLWATSGDGSFTHSDSLGTTYTPGKNDISKGSVALVLNAYPLLSCAHAASDTMILTILHNPTANAGEDDSVCVDKVYHLSGEASNIGSLKWTSSGDGTFGNSADTHTTYTPGKNDVANGIVTLTLTVQPEKPCGIAASDSMQLTIIGQPTAYAGKDDTIAQNETYTLSGKATNEKYPLWISLGDGTFSDTSSLTAVYTPGKSDIQKGSVQIILFAIPTRFCSHTASDTMTLTITTLTQTLSLNTGWNMVSFYVQPKQKSMTAIFQPLISADKIIKIIDEKGGFIQNIPGIGWMNTIGNMANTEGYYVKASSSGSMTLQGQPVTLPFDIPLKTGWNMAGYPIQKAQNAITVLQPLASASKLIKVVSESGRFIQNIPGIGWMNTIGDFYPGKGYYIKVSSDATLSLANPTTKEASLVSVSGTTQLPEPRYFEKSFSGTPYYPMNIVITGMNLGNYTPRPNDEIAVYDDDICVGVGLVPYDISQPVSIVASLDDPTTTQKDGYTKGDPITIKYRSSQMNSSLVVNKKVLFGSDFFNPLETLACRISASSDAMKKHLGDGEINLHIYPNPAKNNAVFEISNPTSGHVLLEIMDMAGKVTDVLYDAMMQQGVHHIRYSVARLYPGIYFVRSVLHSEKGTKINNYKLVISR
jgi:hypothetical protein